MITSSKKELRNKKNVKNIIIVAVNDKNKKQDEFERVLFTL